MNDRQRQHLPNIWRARISINAFSTHLNRTRIRSHSRVLAREKQTYRRNICDFMNIFRMFLALHNNFHSLRRHATVTILLRWIHLCSLDGTKFFNYARQRRGQCPLDTHRNHLMNERCRGKKSVGRLIKSSFDSLHFNGNIHRILNHNFGKWSWSWSLWIYA